MKRNISFLVLAFEIVAIIVLHANKGGQSDVKGKVDNNSFSLAAKTPLVRQHPQFSHTLMILK